MTLVRGFLDCLQNCWPPTAVHKCNPKICIINTALRMCRGLGMYSMSTEALPVFISLVIKT